MAAPSSNLSTLIQTWNDSSKEFSQTFRRLFIAALEREVEQQLNAKHLDEWFDSSVGSQLLQVPGEAIACMINEGKNANIYYTAMEILQRNDPVYETEIYSSCFANESDTLTNLISLILESPEIEDLFVQLCRGLAVSLRNSFVLLQFLEHPKCTQVIDLVIANFFSVQEGKSESILDASGLFLVNFLKQTQSLNYFVNSFGSIDQLAKKFMQQIGLLHMHLGQMKQLDPSIVHLLVQTLVIVCNFCSCASAELRKEYFPHLVRMTPKGGLITASIKLLKDPKMPHEILAMAAEMLQRLLEVKECVQVFLSLPAEKLLRTLEASPLLLLLAIVEAHPNWHVSQSASSAVKWIYIQCSGLTQFFNYPTGEVEVIRLTPGAAAIVQEIKSLYGWYRPAVQTIQTIDGEEEAISLFNAVTLGLTEPPQNLSFAPTSGILVGTVNRNVQVEEQEQKQKSPSELYKE